MDGREVLTHIKEDEGLKTIPTVILTTSHAEADILKSYQLRANCYLTKPVQLSDFESVVQSINDFWLTRAAVAAAMTRASNGNADNLSRKSCKKKFSWSKTAPATFG